MRRIAAAAVLLLVMSVLGVTADPGAPNVGAVPGDTQEASWGLQTKGASATVATWDALGWAVEQIGGTIYAGGNFTQVTNGSNTANQPYLASFDANSGKWQSWFTPTPGNAVFSLLASPDGALFVGGEINTWNGQNVGALVKIDPVTGDLWPGWTTRVYGGTSVVRDLKIEDDGYLYVVGSFNTASKDGVTQSAGGAIRVNPTSGAIDSSWKPTIDSRSIWGVSRSKTLDRVYLAGHFSSVNGVTNTDGFTAVDDNGNPVLDRLPTLPLNNCDNRSYCYEMYDVEATNQGTVWVGGVEHALYVLDENNNYDIKQLHTTSCFSEHSTCVSGGRRGGEYQEIEYDGTNIWASCHCWNDHITAQEAYTIQSPGRLVADYTGEISAFAKYNPSSGLRDESFVPYMSGQSGGFGMHYNTSDGCVWVTGGINSVGEPGNQVPGRGLVRLCDPAIADSNPAPAMPAVPACTTTVDGNNVTVDWTGVDGASSYVIRRAVNGGTVYQRGNTTTLTFTEGIDANKTYTYQVSAKFLASQTSVGTICTPDAVVGGGGGDPVTPPVSCAAIVDGNGDHLVTWPSVDNATDYVVYRSVDGGSDFWRGKVQTTSFTDSPKANSTITYSVLALGAGGDQSAKTVCTPDIVDNGGGGGGGGTVDAVASCTVTVNGGNLDIAWPAANNAVDYRVYRSVDGGTAYWRGKVSTSPFTDTNRTGTLVYTVISVAANGDTAAATTCTGDNGGGGGGGGTVDAVASCTVTVNGANLDIAWPAANNAVDYRVYRSVDGGTVYWRGKVSTTSFTDTNRAGTLVYTVISVAANGDTATATTCTDNGGGGGGGGGLEAPASCSVALVGGNIDVTWPAANDAVDYIIRRSVDGGTDYWRGKVQTTSFTDTNRTGTLQYKVSSKDAAGVESSYTTCTPTLP